MTLHRFVIADFLQSLQSLNRNQLLQMMRSFLSKGITVGHKGFEQMAHEAKLFREEKKLLEEENRKLREENEKLRIILNNLRAMFRP
jgi:cell shape-determining protein MreC